MRFQIGYYFALFITWIGLAGLADDIVTWASWFENGWMHGYRIVRNYLVEIVSDILRIDLPAWVFDYVLVGTIMARASFYLQAREEETIPTVVRNVILIIVFWPVVFFVNVVLALLLMAIMVFVRLDFLGLSQEGWAETKGYLYYLLKIALGFGLLIFVASDIVMQLD